MTVFKRLLQALLMTVIIGGFGAFIDFQLLKSKVDVLANDLFIVQKEVSRIDEVKTLQCEMALHILEGDNKNILRICRE